MDAQKRKALYALAAALGGAAVVFGLLTQEQADAIVTAVVAIGGALPTLAAVVAMFKTVDPVAVPTPDGPVAGPGSDLPDGTKVAVMETERIS